MSKKFSRNARDIAGVTFFRFCSLINRVLPLGIIYKFSDFMGAFMYAVVRKFRETSLESLAIAFGDTLPDEERIKIAKDTMKNFARVGLEILAYAHKDVFLDKYVTVEGQEHIKKAIQRGNGIVALTAHFGNFPVMCMKLVKLGYKVSVMMRPIKDQRLDREVKSIRDKKGVATIYSYPRDEAVKKSMDTLRRNEILVMQMDQNFGTGGIRVDFFGKQAATARGPVVFALRTGATLLPMFIVRDKEDPRRQKIFVEEGRVLKKGGGEDVIAEYVQEFTKLAEKYIRKYPDQWGWMHRRWKS